MDAWLALFLMVIGGAGFLYAFLLKCLLQLDGQYDVRWSLALSCGILLTITQKFTLDAIQGEVDGIIVAGIGMAVISFLLSKWVHDGQDRRFGIFNGLLLAGLSMAIGVGCFIGLVHFTQSHGPIKLSI